MVIVCKIYRNIVVKLVYSNKVHYYSTLPIKLHFKCYFTSFKSANIRLACLFFLHIYVLLHNVCYSTEQIISYRCIVIDNYVKYIWVLPIANKIWLSHRSLCDLFSCTYVCERTHPCARARACLFGIFSPPPSPPPPPPIPPSTA